MVALIQDCHIYSVCTSRLICPCDLFNGGVGEQSFFFSFCRVCSLFFVCSRVVEGFLDALEEMKPTSVVELELQDVELGSSAPQILGIKVKITALYVPRERGNF